MHYLLIYELTPEYLEKRGEFRNEHLALAWQAHDKGELILGGALSDPVDEAILLFKGETAEVAEKFARVDPYVLNGLIKKWSVRPWTTVVGDKASTPVKPAV
ncbi:MAG: YciI-like protein [Syntrophomonadaceae bacterium]